MKNAIPAAKNTKNVKTAKKVASKPAEVITKGPDRTHKICSICRQTQPLDKFYRPADDCRCKDCGKVYAAQLKALKAEAGTPAPVAAKKTAKKTTPVKAATKRTAKKAKKVAAE